MAPQFRLLEHPSDIGVCGIGATREEALIAVSKGLVSIIVDPKPFRPIEKRLLAGDGPDEAAQIVSWLNEIPFFFDAEGIIFAGFYIDSWSSTEIRGHALGERFSIEHHEFRTGVKAVTYHQFESRETARGWEISVFVDV